MPVPVHPTVLYHGGMCCGVKEIAGFIESPRAMAPAIGKLKDLNAGRRDIYGYHVSTSQRWNVEAAPKETNLDRFKRLVALIKSRRPQGLVQAFLTAYQTILWEEHLLNQGFVKDLEFKNSNSGNTIYRYSLVIGGDTNS